MSFHVKEAAMQAHRRAPKLPDEFISVSIYTVLSVTTLQNRRQLARITQILQKNCILYKWGYPLKLLATWQGKSVAISSPEMGLHLCKEWKLIPDSYTLPDSSRPEYMETEWTTFR